MTDLEPRTRERPHPGDPAQRALSNPGRTGISHQRAKQLADDHLRADGSSFVAVHASRELGAWVVSYADPAQPGEILCGGGLVVTDQGAVYSVSSVPGALSNLLMELRLERALERRARA